MQVPPFVAKAWPIVASSVMLALAFAPANLSLLVFVALVPWLNSLRETTGRGAFRSGLTFGLFFWLFQLNWIVPFVSKWTGSIWLGIIPWLIAPILVIWYFGVLACLIRWCWKLDLIWFIPLIWAGIEVARSYVPVIAFPWGLLAGPLWRFPQIIQHASFGSIFFVSAWVCLVNVAFAIAFFDKKPRLAFRMGLIAFLFLAVSWFRYATPSEGTKRVFSLGQTGVNMAFGDRQRRTEDLSVALTTLLSRALIQKADLLILPEGVAKADDSGIPMSSIGSPPPLPVLLGGQRGTHPSFQSTFAFDTEWKHTDKTRLVVFGEFVPFRNLIPGLDSFQLPSGDLTPGDKIEIIKVAGMNVGPMLCFEGLFPNIAAQEAREGAQVLAVLVIDDWYIGTTAPDQLEAGAVWRAAETGLPVLRVGSLGTSMVVDVRGNVTERAPFGETFALRAEVKVPHGSDAFPYAWLFPWICVAGGTWIVVRIVLDSRRKL